MKNKILVILIILSLVTFISIYIFVPKDEKVDNLMIDLVGKTKEDAINFANENNLNLEIKEENNIYEKDKIFKQSIDVNSKINENEKLTNCWFIGWDYAHLGDYYGYDMINMIMPEIYRLGGKKWTTMEILQDVRSVCKQLKESEK